jgi:hypothetical protein
MHISIERYLEGEAAAAGLVFPIVTRDQYGRLILCEADNVIGSNAQMIEVFNDNIDALARLAGVVAMFLSDTPQSGQNRQNGAIRRISGEDWNGGTV